MPSMKRKYIESAKRAFNAAEKDQWWGDTYITDEEQFQFINLDLTDGEMGKAIPGEYSVWLLLLAGEMA